MAGGGERADARAPVSAQIRDPQRYQIIGEHGRGGLGRVARAHDRDLSRDIAIKELISGGAASEVRFLREALITARLEHPGIVPVHEAGRWPDGTPFYAMRLVAGRPLRALIQERTTVDERIGLLHHVIAVADAIAYAHGRNIIHRDLKPANVIVGDFGETVVIDWGLAKEVSAEDVPGTGGATAARGHDLTTTGSVLGTPAYMAPEQERGDPVDQRADVFAIGAMLWELCSLHKLPPRELSVRHRMLREARIDRDLVTIIDKALEVDPSRRYADAGELAADLKAFKAGARIAARDYSLFALLVHWTRRHRALALLTMIVVAVSVAALAISYRAGLRARFAEQLAALSVRQAELEAGRQALLHGESAEPQLHLAEAYRRGDHTPATRFMLARALQPRLAEQARFSARAGRMWSAAFSPDGAQVVTTDDQSAQVWDARTAQLRLTLAHGAPVHSAAFSPDGATLVTAGGDGVVRIWELAHGTLVRALTRDGLRARYFALVVSPDGQQVAASDGKSDVTDVWDARTGAPLAQLHTLGSSRRPALSFSADGRWLAASSGGDARVFETRTWTPVTAVAGQHVSHVSFDPTGPRIATGNEQGDVSIWAVPSGVRIMHLREIGEPVNVLTWSPDGAVLVTATDNGAKQIWDARAGRLRRQLDDRHSRVLWLEVDPSSQVVAAADSDGAVSVIDVATGMPVTVLEGAGHLIMTARFDPSGRRVVAASWDGTARIWDASSPYRRFGAPPVGDDCGLSDGLEPDQRFLAVRCHGHPTRVWDTARDQLLAELPGVTRVAGEFASALPAVSHDGDRAAIAHGHAVELYELPSGRLLRTIAHDAPVNAVAFAPTGHDVVSGATDGSLLVSRDDHASIVLPRSAGGIDVAGFLADGRVVAVDDRRQLRVYDPVQARVLAEREVATRVGALRPSPDGRRLVTIPSYLDSATPAVLWDLTTYRATRELTEHVGRVFSVRWIAGDGLLTSGGDGTARRWSASGELRQTYRVSQIYGGSSRLLDDAALSPDGAIVVAGGDDGMLRFWDADDGQLIWALRAHRSSVIGLHYEGDDLVTRGFSGEIARWQLPDPDRVIAACLGREACAKL